MWTPLSASRWILLLTLGVVMLLSESALSQEHDCCYKKDLTDEKVEIKDIGTCFKQESKSVCGIKAYWIQPKGGNWKCINPKAGWIKELEEQIAEGNIKCPDLFDDVPILEVLDAEEEKKEEEKEDKEEEEKEDEEEEEKEDEEEEE